MLNATALPLPWAAHAQLPTRSVHPQPAHPTSRTRALRMSLDADYDLQRYPFVKGCTVEVCRCTDRRTGAERAVKIYNAAQLDARRLAMAVEEGTIAASLPPAPQLVRVFGVYAEPQRVSLVMEFVPHGSLFQQLTTRGALPPAAARIVARDILAGLAVLHGSGVMHRDIKPENVFLRQDPATVAKTPAAGPPSASGVAAIGDFGFATRRIPHEDFAGSPQYTAPEVALIALHHSRLHARGDLAVPQASAKPLYNEKCDVWSAGVVVFVMLTGLLPFDGATPDEVFMAVVRGTVPYQKASPGQLSASAKAFIQALLTPHPAKRPSATEALRHPWLGE